MSAPAQILSPLFTLPANSDLSASQYCAMDMNSSGYALLPSAGGSIVGVLQNDPDTALKAAELQAFGHTLMKLGGTVAVDDFVKVDSAGRAVTASAGDVAAGYAVGKCILGGAINNIGQILLMNFGMGYVAASGALEIVSAAGAVSVANRTTLLSISGTKAYTIASGLFAGQRKLIQCSVAASIPAGTVTGVFTDTDGTTARTTAAFNAVADALELEWTGSAWQVLTNVSVTMG